MVENPLAPKGETYKIFDVGYGSELRKWIAEIVCVGSLQDDKIAGKAP